MGNLFVVCGAAGAGKSRHAKVLARERGAVLLDSDTVSEAVVRAGLRLAGMDEDERDRDSPRYKETFRDPVYECLYAAAAENLPHLPVVLVGPFTRELRDPGWLDFLERKFSVPVEVVFLDCPDDERRRRIEKRGNPRDAAKLADWENYVRESRLARPAFRHVVVGADA